MFILKVLGSIDLAAATAFLMLSFSIPLSVHYLLFCAGLLFLKGLFILTGNVLSLLDLLSSFLLILSLFLTLPSLFLWTPALLLLAKGLVSFL